MVLRESEVRAASSATSAATRSSSSFSTPRDRRDRHRSRRRNYAAPEYPELEDYGHANLVGNNGATQYSASTGSPPPALRTWGDGRTVILGTEGYMELRKYIDLARDGSGDHLFLANGHGEKEFALKGKVGFPYFGQLILDCLDRTRTR